MNTRVEAAWAALEELTDPEIPVISLRELGILRDVRPAADGLEVVITPTYSGCPAMGQIEVDRGGHGALPVTPAEERWPAVPKGSRPHLRG